MSLLVLQFADSFPTGVETYRRVLFHPGSKIPLVGLVVTSAITYKFIHVVGIYLTDRS